MTALAEIWSNAEIWSKFNDAELENLAVRHDAAGHPGTSAEVREFIRSRDRVQTSDLLNSGQIFKQRVVLDADSGRHAFQYTGDPMAWMASFMTPPRQGHINRDLFSGQNGPAALARAADTARVMAAGRAALAAKPT
jgi:hypothetical protein